MNLSQMSLLQMSISGAVMVLAAAGIRFAAMYKLPKVTFPVLWGAVLVRFLVPFSIPVKYSISSVGNVPGISDAALWIGIHADTAESADMGTDQSINMRMDIDENAGMNKHADENMAAGESRVSFVWNKVWSGGLLICFLYFAVSYIRCIRIFSMSVPVSSPYVCNWVNTCRIRRRICVRQSGFMKAPLTYGIFRPVILMPKYTDWEDTRQLQYILAHEYVHIRRFDAVFKLVLAAACCVHWFNPFVWILYVLANRDMELACDEAVVHKFGKESRSAYAMTLICMEERKSGFAPLCSGFGKNVTEERIIAVMRTKKTSRISKVSAIALAAGMMFVSATSAAAEEPAAVRSDMIGSGVNNSRQNSLKEMEAAAGADFTDREYKMLAALQLDNYQDMTVSQYRRKVWGMIDTQEYIELLDRFYQNGKLEALKDSNEQAYYIHYILEPLTAEKWKLREYGGYVRRTCAGAADDAVLEYSIALHIKNAAELRNCAKINLLFW